MYYGATFHTHGDHGFIYVHTESSMVPWVIIEQAKNFAPNKVQIVQIKLYYVLTGFLCTFLYLNETMAPLHVATLIVKRELLGSGNFTAIDLMIHGFLFSLILPHREHSEIKVTMKLTGS